MSNKDILNRFFNDPCINQEKLDLLLLSRGDRDSDSAVKEHIRLLVRRKNSDNYLDALHADYDGDTVIGNSIRLLNRRKKGPGKGKVKIIQRLISYV
ncbi:hypothetical protein LAB17_002184 [Salmonella enterica subsp. enterica serovar Newport]|jgi:hypothetical protein|nr:hypothetical protein [Salmonella enterica subsp. enterica serovar Newport]EJO8623421.1 hypothetical protein [Salmonella enterica subsp. enterica serovar Newport]